MKIFDLSGKRFGRLLVLQKSNERRNEKVMWDCKCDCGTIKPVQGVELKKGDALSCGCLHKELLAKRNRRTAKHGHALAKPTRTYRTWQSMKRRCDGLTKNHHKYYKSRGITVCGRWQNFENFLQDMGERPAGKTLDRIDNNGNYEPSNCRWATPLEQRHNQRRVISQT